MIQHLGWRFKGRLLFFGALLVTAAAIPFFGGQETAAALDIDPCDGAPTVGCFLDDAIGGGGGSAGPSVDLWDLFKVIIGGDDSEPTDDPPPPPQQEDPPWEDRAAEDAAYCPGDVPNPPARCQ